MGQSMGRGLAYLAVKWSLRRLYGQSRANKDVGCLLVVGDAIGPVVEDLVIWGDSGLVKRVAGDRSLGDRRRLGKDALAGAAGVELVGWEDSADFEWFEHDFFS